MWVGQKVSLNLKQPTSKVQIHRTSLKTCSLVGSIARHWRHLETFSLTCSWATAREWSIALCNLRAAPQAQVVETPLKPQCLWAVAMGCPCKDSRIGRLFCLSSSWLMLVEAGVASDWGICKCKLLDFHRGPRGEQFGSLFKCHWLSAQCISVSNVQSVLKIVFFSSQGF